MHVQTTSAHAESYIVRLIGSRRAIRSEPIVGVELERLPNYASVYKVEPNVLYVEYRPSNGSCSRYPV